MLNNYLQKQSEVVLHLVFFPRSAGGEGREGRKRSDRAEPEAPRELSRRKAAFCLLFTEAKAMLRSSEFNKMPT